MIKRVDLQVGGKPPPLFASASIPATALRSNHYPPQPLSTFGKREFALLLCHAYFLFRYV